MKHFLALLLPIGLLISSCTQEPPSAQVTYHTQTPPGEPSNLVFKYTHRGRVINLRQMPSITLADLETYKPFLTKDGTYGAIFNCNRTGKLRLFHHTAEQQGYYMVSIVNGNLSEPLKIDQPVRDGKLIVWKGLSETDLLLLDVTLPREGESDEEAKERGKNALKELKAMGYEPPQPEERE